MGVVSTVLKGLLTQDSLYALAVILLVFAAGLALDVSSVLHMFLNVPAKTSQNASLPIRLLNWFISLLFTVSFIQSIRAQGKEDSGLDTLIVSVLATLVTFGYLLLFFCRCYLNETGNKKISTSQLVFGVIFACGAIGWSVLPKPRYIATLPAFLSSYVSSTPLFTSLGWCLVFVLILYIVWSQRNPSTQILTAHQIEHKKMRANTYPAPYPNGWYKLMESDELAPGEVKYVQCLGQDLAVYRGQSGSVSVLDAYCPHLGANIAVGGKVVGDCVQCPFHLWEFGSDGKATNIPYCSTIPDVAKTRSWPVVEYHNQICFYFDTEFRHPPYELDRIAEIDNGTLVYRGRFETSVDMHLQEFAENSVDFMHFEPLHGQMVVPWTSIPIPYTRIIHSPNWTVSQKSPHIAYFEDKAVLEVFGQILPSTRATAVITFLGPGGMVHFRFMVPNLGEIVVFQTHTPVEPTKQKISFVWYSDPNVGRLLTSYVVGNWVSQWKNDLMVWENKIYRPQPLLVAGDGPVSKLRQWYRQFYSKGEARRAVCPDQDEEKTTVQVEQCEDSNHAHNLNRRSPQCRTTSDW